MHQELAESAVAILQEHYPPFFFFFTFLSGFLSGDLHTKVSITKDSSEFLVEFIILF